MGQFIRIIGIWGVIGVIVSAVPAWLTHIACAIKTEQWMFCVVGAVIPPIGAIHGWGVWLGFW